MLSSWTRQRGWFATRRRSSGVAGIPDASNLRGYIEGDNLDGMNNTTLVNGVGLAAVTNLGTLGGTFVQAVALNQPTYSTTAGPGGTKSAFVLDASDSLVSSLAASSWTFLHDGTGATVYTVARTSLDGVSVIASTSTTQFASDRGMSQQRGATRLATFVVSDGTNFVINANSGINATNLNVFDAIISTLASADTPDFTQLVNGTSVATANATGFSALAPVIPLTIGNHRAGSSFAMPGPYRRVMVYAGAHGATTRAAVIAFMQGLDAVTYPAA